VKLESSYFRQPCAGQIRDREEPTTDSQQNAGSAGEENVFCDQPGGSDQGCLAP
jgi:hypothetical protein